MFELKYMSIIHISQNVYIARASVGSIRFEYNYFSIFRKCISILGLEGGKPRVFTFFMDRVFL